MTCATLIKINQNKKLMMKITEKTFTIVHDRLMAESRKRNFPVERLATFTLTNDRDEENFFLMVSLDKYDKLNMLKIEKMLRKEASFQYRLKPYDFIADNEKRCGINVELVSIRQHQERAVKLNAEEQAIDEDVEKQVAEQLPSPPVLQRQNAYVATGTDMSVPELIRRRRRADYIPHRTESELTGVLAEVQKLEDLIAANELAIGATE